MASAVEICNSALQKLGAKRIVALEDDSVNARACNFSYEIQKRAELRKHSWNCAIKRASIAADSTTPIFTKTNYFTLPSDWIRMVDTDPEDNFNFKDWQIEGNKIATNYDAPLEIRYIYDVTDPNEMDSLFREVLATRMAIAMCEELTQSNTKKDDLRVDYKLLVDEAKKINAIERESQEPPLDTWISIRE